MSQSRNEGGLTHNNLEGTSRSTSIDPQTEGAENRGSTSTTQSTGLTSSGGRGSDSESRGNDDSRSNVSHEREEAGTEGDHEEMLEEDLEDDEDVDEEE